MDGKHKKKPMALMVDFIGQGITEKQIAYWVYDSYDIPPTVFHLARMDRAVSKAREKDKSVYPLDIKYIVTGKRGE